jgi:transcriptional regulator with XRE-family HTH domain
MPKRKAAPGLGDRLRQLRERLAIPSLAEMARRMGQNYGTYRKWELLNSAPAPETLKRSVQLLGVRDFERLFLWLVDGASVPPEWFLSAGPVPYEDPAAASFPLSASPTPTAHPAVRPLVGSPPRSSLPWRALEFLVQQGRQAQERGDVREAASLEGEILSLICPRCLAGRHVPPQGGAVGTHEGRTQ